MSKLAWLKMAFRNWLVKLHILYYHLVKQPAPPSPASSRFAHFGEMLCTITVTFHHK